jgi:glycosyltransferase involved in cell wall biosynthesis
MTLDIAIPVLNQRESTQESLNSLKRTQQHPHRYIIIDNGSTPPVREWLQGLDGDDIVIRNSSNVGLPKALNQALEVSKADYVFNTHSDITMYEDGWDVKVEEAISEAGNVGVAGFFGAYGIGAFGIYNAPYHFTQLARQQPMAGVRCHMDTKIHGHSIFPEKWRKCAVLDGFSLIVKNDGSLKFWDKSVHHQYDNAICLEAWSKGMRVICINLEIQHHGGRTDVGENWAEGFGKTKDEIHKESHLPLYEMWKPGMRNITLPYYVT